MQILESRVSDECGCPEEDLECCGLFMTIHHEEDKTGHIIVDWGDLGDEDFFCGECQNMQELRCEAEKLGLHLLATRDFGNDQSIRGGQ